jgi:hypothetical protein
VLREVYHWRQDYFGVLILLQRRSQWPSGLRHKLSVLSRTLGSWVQIPLEAQLFVLCAFILCVGRDLASG